MNSLIGSSEVMMKFLCRNLNNILRCSSLVMSDCGLLLELGSFNRRGRPEYFIAFSPALTLAATPD